MQEAAAGGISVNVVGFSLGNAWMAPEEQSMSYGPMLYQLVNNLLRVFTVTLPSTKKALHKTATRGSHIDLIQTFFGV